MRQFVAVLLLAGLAGPAVVSAQSTPPNPPPPADGGQRRFAPPPDHWLTTDSLVQQLNITAAQRQAVLAQWNGINAVLKEAAQVRDSMRQVMQSGGGERPGPEAMQAMRTRMEPMQAELDSYFDALRKLLTPDQQAKLDALPRPAVMRRMQRPPAPAPAPPPGQD